MAVNINVPSQVKTYANLAAFPATGALKTIYIAEDTNKTYRWTGSVYTEISASAAMTWGAIGGTLSNQTDLQSALDAKVPTSRTLTINGVTQDLSANRTFTISTGITIGSTAIASGVVGRVLFEGAGNVVQESANLFWDNTNVRLGVGTSTPITAVEVKKTGSDSWITASRGTNTFHAGFLFNPSGSWTASNVLWNFGLYANTNDLRYWTYNGSTDTNVLNLFGSTANVGIGTTTDAGFRLDVNGTARVQGTFSALNASSNGIRLTNVPSIEFWAAVSRITLQRAGNNALVIGGQSGFAMSTVNAGTMIGGVDQNSLLASAQLQVDSTTKGFLPPRMTTTQKNAIVSPAAGLMVYDTTLNVISYYNGTMWI